MRPLKPYNSYGFRDVRNVMSPSFLYSQGPPGPPGPSFDVVNKLFDFLHNYHLFFCVISLFQLFTKYALHVYNVLTFCCRNL